MKELPDKIEAGETVQGVQLCPFGEYQGAEAVSNRRLRFLSPVWPLDGEGRPTHLKSVALTNTPRIPVAPVLNKAQPGDTNVEDTKENETMDKIKEALGLAPEASEEEVLAAIA